MLELKVGDKVRVKHGWNPMAPARTVTSVDAATREAALDCTPENGVRVTADNEHIWEKVV
jgi:hypothetical protein